ncbi:GntR family transcriptional regulator [Marinomonas ostreistagni]|uniref:GntR family transcriptional regulator n=1 Tax=Marinomonas ostreistagni TaxID=359209 RepID=UPI00195203A9|nr:GntR family transcriptional regulator [Marinomonas ostreistagni]
MADFLYQGVVDWFLEQMSQGELTPGDKMPSLRKLAKQLELSLNTVIHGYEILAEQGWIESRPKSGYFVCHKPSAKQAHLLAGDRIAEFEASLAKKMPWSALSHRAALVDQSDEFLFPVHKAGEPDLPVLGKGHLAVREAVSEHLRKIAIKAHPAHIWLGRSPLAMFTQALQTLTQAGDKILVITPCDPRLTSTGLSLGREVVTLAAGERGVDLDEAVRCLRDDDIRLVVFPSQFGFPAGIEISNLSLRRWLAILQQVDIPAIEWDMTSHLGYKNAPLMTYKSLDERNQIVYIGGLESKGVDRNAAWCLPSQYSALEGALLSADLALSDPQQQALIDALESNTSKHALGRRARQIWSLAEKAKSTLEQTLGDWVRFAPAKGGLALWLQLEQPLSDDQLTQLLAKHRHGLVPGELLAAQADAKHWLAVNVSYDGLEALAAQLHHVKQSQTAVLVEPESEPAMEDSLAESTIDEPVLDDAETLDHLAEAPVTSEQDALAADMAEAEQLLEQQTASIEALEEVMDQDLMLADEDEAVLEAEQMAQAIEHAEADVPTDELMAEAEAADTVPDEAKDDEQEPTKTVYNPMLDLINHDFG